MRRLFYARCAVADPAARSWPAVLAGPLLFAVVLVLPAPGGFSIAAWQVAALALWMATWWLTEALPLPVTALLPLLVLPVLGVSPLTPVAAQFAHPVVWLFFGGFALSLALERHGLHQRLVAAVLGVTGHGPRAALGGIMLATAGLSLWLNNTSAALAMLPAGRALIGRWPTGDEGAQRFARAVLLGIAYAATLGGLGTLVGTAPNAFLAAFLQDTYGIEIGFARWMLIGMPLAAVLLLASWALLVRQHRLPASDPPLQIALAQPPWTTGERRLAVVFGLLVAAWLLRPLAPWPWAAQLGDAGVAVAAALVLFVMPSGGGDTRPLLEWSDLDRLPWGVLVMFGGGLALAEAVSGSGLAQALGGVLTPLTGGPPWLILAAVVGSIILISELASNVAVAAAFLPVVGAFAVAGGGSVLELAIPAGLAASCAFMLPVGTPPNALAFSEGVLSVRDMARAGMYLNLLSWLLLTLAVPPLLRLLF
jgi:sodium-dependent dicarboxylate transporter 2/3/5